MSREIFKRSSLLLGDDVMASLSCASVILFGVGGVGSWCAEGLVRTGIGKLTLVDSDSVNATNVNRQLEATCSTLGRPKVEAMKERLLDINPDAQITILRERYTRETAPSFKLEDYDYVIDAIDSLSDKIALILHASSLPGTKLFSSMGAALKVDPAKVEVAEFWDVRGCPLAALIRKKMRREGTFPKRKVLCVYDGEVLPNLGSDDSAPEEGRAVTNGSVAPVTAIFGMTLAGLVIKDLYSNTIKKQ